MSAPQEGTEADPSTTVRASMADAAIRLRIRKIVEIAVPTGLLGMLLFGSRARGDASPESDWDVAVFVEESTDVGAVRDRLSDALFEAWPDRAVDAQAVILRPSDLVKNRSLALNIHSDGIPL